MSTFDSLELELARYSDDGRDADERVTGMMMLVSLGQALSIQRGWPTGLYAC